MPEAFVLETLCTARTKASRRGRCADRLRRASVVEWGTVALPDDPDLGPEQLADLLATSGRGEPKEFRVSIEPFNDLMDGEVAG